MLFKCCSRWHHEHGSLGPRCTMHNAHACMRTSSSLGSLLVGQCGGGGGGDAVTIGHSPPFCPLTSSKSLHRSLVTAAAALVAAATAAVATAGLALPLSPHRLRSCSIHQLRASLLRSATATSYTVPHPRASSHPRVWLGNIPRSRRRQRRGGGGCSDRDGGGGRGVWLRQIKWTPKSCRTKWTRR